MELDYSKVKIDYTTSLSNGNLIIGWSLIGFGFGEVVFNSNYDIIDSETMSKEFCDIVLEKALTK